MFEGSGTPLTQAGFDQAVLRLGVSPAVLWAVMAVETRGSGFLDDRRPKILFERHIFRKRTGGMFDAVAPDLSGEAGGYKGGAAEYDRLERAVALDRQAALESCSWGLGQVMGFNAAIAGFADAEDMVGQMANGEDAQVAGMAGFIHHNKLSGFLEARDWAGFAAGYNGAAFAKNQYDTKLMNAFAKCDAGEMPDLRVRAAQLYLTYAGHHPGPVDGVMGRKTREALRTFQQKSHIAATGEADDATLAVLRA